MQVGCKRAEPSFKLFRLSSTKNMLARALLELELSYRTWAQARLAAIFCASSSARVSSLTTSLALKQLVEYVSALLIRVSQKKNYLNFRCGTTTKQQWEVGTSSFAFTSYFHKSHIAYLASQQPFLCYKYTTPLIPLGACTEICHLADKNAQTYPVCQYVCTFGLASPLKPSIKQLRLCSFI